MAGSTISIRPLDLHDASASEWAAFHVFRRIRHAESYRDEPLLADAAVEAYWHKRSPYWQHVGWAAWEDSEDGGRIVVCRVAGREPSGNGVQCQPDVR